MPSCHINDPGFDLLVDRYAGRIVAHVAEHSGGRFDIALTVGGLEIACLRLRGAADKPIMFYTLANGEAAALAADGSMVPLP